MNSATTEQLTQTQRANTEALLELMRTALNSMERLAALNLGTLREAIDEDSKRPLPDIGKIGRMETLPADIAQPSLERTRHYYHNLYELVLGMQKEISEVMESHYRTLTANANQTVQETAKKLPAGGDIFSATMQAMLQASAQTFNRMNSLTQQMNDLANNNLQAISRLGETLTNSKK